MAQNQSITLKQWLKLAAVAAVIVPLTYCSINKGLEERTAMRLDAERRELKAERKKREAEYFMQEKAEELRNEWKGYAEEQEIKEEEKLPKTRGVTNNNPGNIEYNETNWLGLIGRDGRFCRFKSHEYGLRAIGINLQTYSKKYGLNTIEGIVRKWAPESDGNQTEDYITDVCRFTGYKPSQGLNLHDKEMIIKIIGAIARRDSGARYSRKRLEKAYSLMTR